MQLHPIAWTSKSLVLWRRMHHCQGHFVARCLIAYHYCIHNSRSREQQARHRQQAYTQLRSGLSHERVPTSALVMHGASLSQRHGPVQAAWSSDADLHTLARENALESTSELTTPLAFGGSWGSACPLHHHSVNACTAPMPARIAAASAPYTTTDLPL